MTVVLPFTLAKSKATPRKELTGLAEIVIFPGVRFERLESSSEALDLDPQNPPEKLSGTSKK